MATTASTAGKLVKGIKSLIKAPVKKPAAAKADRATPLLDARKAGKEATPAMLQKVAKETMFLHFTRHSPYYTAKGEIPIITKASGHHFWDQHDRRERAAGRG